MRIAAAKLSVAAGASPAEAQRVSGIRRVEIKRELDAVKRQTDKLDKAWTLAGEDIPRRLVSPDQVLSDQGAKIADDYLEISIYARRQKTLCLFRKAISDLNQEFNRISVDFLAKKDKFKRLSIDYDRLGEDLKDIILSSFGDRHHSSQLMQDHAHMFSWTKRNRLINELQSVVRQRDSLQTQLSEIASQLAGIVVRFQRHHARRAYLRSPVIREYSNYKSLFIPRATMYGMGKFDFDNTRVARPDEVAKMLQLAERWNQLQIAFAAERTDLKARNDLDETNDYSLINLFQMRRTNSGR